MANRIKGITVEIGGDTTEFQTAPTVQEAELQEAVVKAINQALGNRDSIMAALEQNIEAVLAEKANQEGLKQQIEEMKEFLVEQTREIEIYDEQLVRRLIEKITVYDEKFVVEFKSGVSMDVGR